MTQAWLIWLGRVDLQKTLSHLDSLVWQLETNKINKIPYADFLTYQISGNTFKMLIKRYIFKAFKNAFLLFLPFFTQITFISRKKVYPSVFHLKLCKVFVINAILQRWSDCKIFQTESNPDPNKLNPVLIRKIFENRQSDRWHITRDQKRLARHASKRLKRGAEWLISRRGLSQCSPSHQISRLTDVQKVGRSVCGTCIDLSNDI